ncbi:MAG: TonB-dependent receptor [Saprospiraceae bacterium]
MGKCALWRVKGGMFLVHLLFPLLLWGQECHLHLYGYVRNATGGKPIDLVSVFLKESGNGSLADSTGYFHLEGICPGSYTLLASRVGFEDAVLRLLVTKDTGVTLLLREGGILLEKIEVRADKPLPFESRPRDTISGAMLEAGRGFGLAESLRRLPGISVINTGPTIGKPVIQGLHSNRVLILNNGVRQEGQQWGAEHAPEIDPFLAKQIAVIKGAGAIRYGADALGGIILVQPAPLRTEPGIGGEINLQGMSNGRMGIASALLEGKLGRPQLPLSGRVQGTVKRGGNLSAPDYFMRNTGVAEYNFSWALRLDQDRWASEVFYARFFGQIGILQDAHIGNLTDLQNAIVRERPLQDGAFTYFIGRPQQQMLHELVKGQVRADVGRQGKLEFQASRQFNRREEFDAHRLFNTLPNRADQAQIILEITTHQLSANWEHRWLKHLQGDAGMQFMTQTNTTDRGGLLPNFTNRVMGAYWSERWRNYPDRFEAEFGLRYDIQDISVVPAAKDSLERRRAFRGLSGSLGAAYNFGQGWKLSANMGTSWRAPHVSELYSEGVHHGSASFEQGNPTLLPERAWNNSLTLEWKLPGSTLGFFLSGYVNMLRNFIFLNPRQAPVLTIRGAFPAFGYDQANARLTGIDAQVSFQPLSRVRLEAQGSVLQSWSEALRDFLVFMPPNQFRYALRFHSLQDEPQRFVQLNAVHVLRQQWAPGGVDYAPPPKGYLRLDLEAALPLMVGSCPLELGASWFNLLDVTYRDYLNRLRYFTAEMGRNLMVRAKLTF